VEQVGPLVVLPAHTPIEPTSNQALTALFARVHTTAREVILQLPETVLLVTTAHLGLRLQPRILVLLGLTRVLPTFTRRISVWIARPGIFALQLPLQLHTTLALRARTRLTTILKRRGLEVFLVALCALQAIFARQAPLNRWFVDREKPLMLAACLVQRALRGSTARAIRAF